MAEGCTQGKYVVHGSLPSCLQQQTSTARRFLEHDCGQTILGLLCNRLSQHHTSCC